MGSVRPAIRFLAAAVILSAATAFFFWRLARYLGDLPDPSRLFTWDPLAVTRMYDREGEILAEFFQERREPVPLGRIPMDLQHAVLAIEDHRFFRHWGLDVRRIAKAAWENLRAGRVVQGGSTITQQLAKNLFLTRRRTLDRKLKEVLLALQLERDYTKPEILEMYLNQVYLGAGTFGVASAAKRYFGKEVEGLTLSEAALLAALIRAPAAINPFHKPEAALGRRNLVLWRMRELGYLDEARYRQAIAEPIVLEPRPPGVRQALYFVEWVRPKLEERLGPEMARGGLQIYTTLEAKWQRQAEDLLKERLTLYEKWISAERRKRGETARPEGEPAGSTEPLQGALLLLDPKSGAIRAMVGGRDFLESQFNRAAQAMRQPGSAFKIFTYTAAMASGMTPVSILEDAPRHYFYTGRRWEVFSRTPDFSDVDPALLEEILQANARRQEPGLRLLWSPQNYSRRFRGPVLLRRALEHSLNVCAVQTIETIGPERVVETARRLGIAGPLEANLSLALGTNEVSLLEMTGAVAALANAGVYNEPYAIEKVTDRYGRILYEHQPRPREAIPADVAYVMTHLLRGVVERGTGRAANFGRPAAGKTGTTNEFRDAWFLGYTPQYACGVWVGYDDRRSLGERRTGGALAAPIWRDFMRQVHRGLPVLDFSVPSGVTFRKIDPRSGLLALGQAEGAYLEAFISGTEPKEFSLAAGVKVSPALEEEAAVPALTDATTGPAPVLQEITGSEGGY